MTAMANEGVIIRIVVLGPALFAWAMRKDNAEPFMRSRGYFPNAKQAETNARYVIMRANRKVAFVETVTERP